MDKSLEEDIQGVLWEVARIEIGSPASVMISSTLASRLRVWGDKALDLSNIRGERMSRVDEDELNKLMLEKFWEELKTQNLSSLHLQASMVIFRHMIRDGRFTAAIKELGV